MVYIVHISRGGRRFFFFGTACYHLKHRFWKAYVGVIVYLWDGSRVTLYPYPAIALSYFGLFARGGIERALSAVFRHLSSSPILFAGLILQSCKLCILALYGFKS
jgi:hypothetical protein